MRQTLQAARNMEQIGGAPGFFLPGADFSIALQG